MEYKVGFYYQFQKENGGPILGIRYVGVEDYFYKFKIINSDEYIFRPIKNEYGSLEINIVDNEKNKQNEFILGEYRLIFKDFLDKYNYYLIVSMHGNYIMLPKNEINLNDIENNINSLEKYILKKNTIDCLFETLINSGINLTFEEKELFLFQITNKEIINA